MKIQLLACGLLMSALVIQSCYHELPEPEIDPCSGDISFESQVKPIINTSCALTGCHNGSLGPDRNWTVFSALQAKSASVKDRIKRSPGTPGHMPAIGSLTSEQIQTIVCWVDQGAKAN